MAAAPPDSAPSATALRLVELLRPYTPFAEAIVKRQAERAGRTLATLAEVDVPTVGPMIVTAASVFVDPAALAALRASLRKM